ncbi:MAG: sigma-70 family RNA polymerase sigma factor [Planctomycetota bacterium]|jgi:RNA polymerase sigma factor (TIGR02999 family)
MPGDGQITQLLAAIGSGDRAASDELLPLVYDQLRGLARKKMAGESPGHTLQPTALVHEAYLRLVGDASDWDSRGHFYVAAAEAMRRILVERARRYDRQKHGGGRQRVPLAGADAAADENDPIDVLALDTALRDLQSKDPRLYDVVMLRHFTGLSNEETALTLGISERTVSREWSYARLWLVKALTPDEDDGNG